MAAMATGLITANTFLVSRITNNIFGVHGVHTAVLLSHAYFQLMYAVSADGWWQWWMVWCSDGLKWSARTTESNTYRSHKNAQNVLVCVCALDVHVQIMTFEHERRNALEAPQKRFFSFSLFKFRNKHKIHLFQFYCLRTTDARIRLPNS